MRLLQANPDALEDFNDWIDQHITLRSYHIVNTATSFDEILGMRYLIGDLEQMRTHINAPLEEEAQLQEMHYHGGGDMEPVAQYPGDRGQGEQQQFWRDWIRNGERTDRAE